MKSYETMKVKPEEYDHCWHKISDTVKTEEKYSIF